MRVLERVLLALLSIALLGGCASSPAPQGYLVTASEEVYDTRGAWIELEMIGSPGGRSRVEGELLACDTDSVHVLVARHGIRGPAEVLSYDWLGVHRWKARAYDPGTGTYAATTAAGTLSTISHGWFLVFSAPLWLIAGTAMTAEESGSADLHPEDGAARLGVWARFPQGLPPGLDRHSLTLQLAREVELLPLRFRSSARDWSEY